MRALWMVAILLPLAGCTDSDPACRGFDDCPAPSDDADMAEASAPNISFSKQAAQNRLQVTSVDADTDWQDMHSELSGDCTVMLHSGGMTHDAHGTMAPHEMPIAAGDYVQFDGTGTCGMEMSHTPTNTLLGSWDFQL